MKIQIRVHLIIIIAFLVCTSQSGISQGIKKNAFYGSIGAVSFFGTYTNYTATYERTLKPKMWNRNISSFIKVGIGGTAFKGGTSIFGGRVSRQEGKYVYSQYGILIGANKNKLEMGLGVTRYISGTWESDGLLVAANLGWRYREPGGNFVFRLGGSYPELLYVSVGFYF